MNSRSIFLAAVLASAATAFTSCTKNDAPTNDDVQVLFTAAIDQATPNAVPSRATGEAWAPGDAIGVFMVGHGTQTIAEGVQNRKFTTPTGNSNFSTPAGDEVYYPTGGSLVDFIAYYPHRNDATLSASINVTIGSQDNQPLFDLVWTTANNSGAGFSKLVTGAVALPFEHKLAKLVMNCKAGLGLTDAELQAMTATITGMNTTNTFNLSAGTLGTPATVADITPRTLGSVPQGGYAIAYDAIIMPGDYLAGDIKVGFTIGTDVFTWTADAITFAPGNEYIYDVTITRTGVQVTGTIKKWTENVMSGVTAW